MDVRQYAELFQAEAGEYMQVLNQCLLKLEENPRDNEQLKEAFRAVHSLKGMAGTMGYNHVTTIAHGLENFMEDFKTFEREPSPEIVDLLFEAVDLLQDSLETPEVNNEEDEKKWGNLISEMNKARDKQDADEEDDYNCEQNETGQAAAFDLGVMDQEIMRQALERGDNPCCVKIVLKENVVMKSVRIYMIFKALEECGEVIAAIPSQQDLEEEKFALEFQVLFVPNNCSQETVQAKLSQITDVEEIELGPWQAADEAAGEAEPAPAALPEQDSTTPVEAREREVPETYVPEENVKEPEQEAGKNTEHVEIKEQPSTKEEKEEKTSEANKAADKMVRVETQKLDDLVNLVGEMVVARTRISEIGHGFNEDLDSTIDQLKRSITNLQDTAMELRMVPIGHAFGRFPRMVRDLCREKGKKVQLHISGEETELDRSIINRLSDPLVHLLRNAFDHGIESPEERTRKGKNPEGSIYLKACHEGNQVVITVEDDGGGIDPQKIGRIAIQKGLITEEEYSQLSNDDLISLIFFSGFSTSEEVTDVSGRGVGMDAVRNSIEALHGAVEVASEIGFMTRFEIRLPLTLAIITTLLVKSMHQLYAIPVEVINENVYLDRREIKTIRGNPVVNLRGEVVPLYFLSSMLGFESGELPESESSVVIVEAAGRKAGFIVDDLIGQQEIMIKSLGEIIRGLKGIAGATVLGDGSVTLIIDVAGLLSEGRDYVE